MVVEFNADGLVGAVSHGLLRLLQILHQGCRVEYLQFVVGVHLKQMWCFPHAHGVSLAQLSVHMNAETFCRPVRLRAGYAGAVAVRCVGAVGRAHRAALITYTAGGVWLHDHFTVIIHISVWRIHQFKIITP